jgi:tetratricopeptide (TPR) repeat protein
MLASGGTDYNVKVWNVDSWTPKYDSLTGHSNEVTSVAFSPDGSMLVSGGADETILIWNLTNGEILRNLTGHTADVTSVAFSQDGTKVISSGGYDFTIRFWDVSTGGIIEILSAHTGKVTSLTVTEDDMLASGSADAMVIFWNATTMKELQTLTDYTSSVTSLSFSPNGSLLASGDVDGIILLWNASTIPTDLDFDGMDDGWEREYGLSPIEFTDKFDDRDKDGLMNGLEFFLHSNASNTDSDGDSMPDRWEYLVKLDLMVNDSGDDSEQDEIPNLYEYQMELNPWVDDANFDNDRDGLTNLVEFYFGSWANQSDSDMDEMPDLWEYQMRLLPLVDDASEDKDDDGMPNLWEYKMNLNATDDTDASKDQDDDGMPNLWEYEMNLNATDDTDASKDQDDDGMPNLWEYKMNLNATDGTDASKDQDNDGMDNLWEYKMDLNATDPSDAKIDSDGDWVVNVDEYRGGSDARNFWDVPIFSLSVLHIGMGVILLIVIMSILTTLYYQSAKRKALVTRLKAPDYSIALKIQETGFSDYEAYLKVEKSARRAVKAGNVLFHQGKYLEAIENYEEALEKFNSLKSDLFIAKTFVRIAMVQKESQILSTKSTIIQRFPQPPYEDPNIISYHHMLQALIAETEKNWGSADKSWRKSLSFKDLDNDFKIICQEALVESEVKNWLDHPSSVLQEKLIMRLNRWQEACVNNERFDSLCKVYLLRVRVELATFQFDKVEEWLNLCLKTADENNLSRYKNLAQKETKIYLQHKKRIFDHIDQEKRLKEYIRRALNSLEGEQEEKSS